jgi:hypothetical protein
VTVVSFGRLAELMGQLAADDLTEVGGPWWDLRPASAGADQRVEPVCRTGRGPPPPGIPCLILRPRASRSGQLSRARFTITAPDLAAVRA